jgi:CRP-like cAMP-binding protein
MLFEMTSFDGSGRVFHRGQYLFRQGDSVSHMLFIGAGEARLVRRQPDGNERRYGSAHSTTGDAGAIRQ